MAKNNSKLKVASLVIALAVLFSGIVATWAIYGENIEDTAADVDELKEDGCKPSQKNGNDINLINYRLDDIQTTQQIMQTDQRADMKEILRRLPE